ncbi:MAG TPA: SDR family oxidoreductase [Verrucomicrobiae bacterium]|jgi:nucleoside-diphosphate-sugar epimerase|nr:SDR family oxidoreductase [Verrucomicrobiae bacterium]
MKAPRKILITGNMGYVGPVVVRHLREALPETRLEGLDTGYFAHCLVGSPVLPETRVDAQHFADVRTVTEDIFEGVDAVVHLAGISNDAIGQAFDEVTLDTNYKGTVRLAEMAKKAGVRSFAFASSCSLYGFSEEGAKTETSALDPLTAYARSKFLAEGGLKPLADAGFNVTCLRFATACGMSERLRLDLVLNDFVANALFSGRIDILSDGTPWRPLIHVRDMARAFEWAVQRDPSAGDYLVVNVGTDAWNYQVRDLAHAVQRHFPEAVVSINEKAAPDRRSYRVNFSLFRSLAPDHQPRISLDMAVRELKAGLEPRDGERGTFDKPKYIRLNVLRQLKSRGVLSETIHFNKNYESYEGAEPCPTPAPVAVSANA